MSFFVVAAILVSACLHAGWNALLHKSDDPSTSIVVSYLSFGMLLSPALLIDPPIEVLGWAFLSGIFHAIYISALSFSILLSALIPVVVSSETPFISFIKS